MDEIEKRTIGKVMWRLLPFLIVCYFVAYLDRVNVGFAALQMNAALGFSESAFGFGAGLFFIAYFLLEVPSNLALDRFGARLWIARIMLSWGILSGLMALIPEIARSTHERGLVVDPFMGSGSTCIAARNTRRRYLGVELDEQWYEVAQRRLADPNEEG